MEEIPIDPGRILSPLSDADWALFVQWAAGRGFTPGNMAWMAVQILDLIRRAGGEDNMDVLLAVIDSRYNAGRRRES